KLIEETVAAYLYDEISPQERAAYDAHLAGCEPCRKLVEESQRLQGLLSQRDTREPTPELIVHCRQALDEALDREQLGWRYLVRHLLPLGLNKPSRVSAAGALTAVALAVFGFGLGWTLRPHSSRLVS